MMTAMNGQSRKVSKASSVEDQRVSKMSKGKKVSGVSDALMTPGHSVDMTSMETAPPTVACTVTCSHCHTQQCYLPCEIDPTERTSVPRWCEIAYDEDGNAYHVVDGGVLLDTEAGLEQVGAVCCGRPTYPMDTAGPNSGSPSRINRDKVITVWEKEEH